MERLKARGEKKRSIGEKGGRLTGVVMLTGAVGGSVGVVVGIDGSTTTGTWA